MGLAESKLTTETNATGHAIHFRKLRRGEAKKKKGKRVQVCGSPLRRKPGERCGVEVGLSARNGRCRLHGKDAGAPIQTGQYSEALGPLREAYETMRARGGARDLEDAITIIDLRVAELVAGLETRDSPDFRLEAVRLALKAKDDGEEDHDLGKKAVDDLISHLEAGADRDKAWDSVVRNLERRARRAEALLNADSKKDRALTDKAVLGFLQGVIEVIVKESPEDVADRIVKRITTQLEDPAIFTALPGVGSRN